MTQEAIKTEVRLLAIETMLGNLYSLFIKVHDIKKKSVWDGHDALLIQSQNQTFDFVHPAQSDMLADELHRALQSLIDRIELMAGMERPQ